MKRTARLISLGCAKALVDNESMAANLRLAGWDLIADGPADLVVVGTCAFIEEAATEAVETILAEIDLKNQGETKWLAVVGCLPEKYRDKLATALPEIDVVAGINDLFRLDRLMEKVIASGKRRLAVSPLRRDYIENDARLLSTPSHRAYLKIAEGCSNACAYCIIGRLRGPFRSRKPEAILEEAAHLVQNGAVELDLIAQDLTRYGKDLSPASSLVELIRGLDRIEGLRWQRLLYVHPARVDRALAEAMADSRTVTPYLDLPLQHVSDRILRRMNRPQTKVQSEQVLALLRETIPDIALRTTFLLGHPGETDDDFEELLDFVEKWRFAHLGAFAWSPEEETPSFEQGERVDPELAQERVDRLLTLQQEISREVLEERVGDEVDVLVEEVLHKHDDDAFSHVGRIAQQAPEVDGVTYLRAPTEEACAPGRIVRAKVIEADDYDLFADLL